MAAVYEAPIEAQLSSLRLDAAHLASLRALAGRSVPSAAPLVRRQLERELADKARDHAARRISTPAYLAEHARLTRALDELDAAPGESALTDPDESIQILQDLQAAWRDGDEGARRAVVQAVYQRITVSDDRIAEAS